MFTILISIFVISSVASLWALNHLLAAERADRIRREQVFQKWLFDSLYSISNKVVLPDTHEIKEDDNLKASVYSPEEDPMSEFEGTIDDFHGPMKRD